ncbi:MAG: protein phosphatase 2C domain-containing protein, partial [Bifidobacteriaceae bacterium]|nr:protein phosphatase 2C domain-containing protein [Bifidobacteriaceae bacterium]
MWWDRSRRRDGEGPAEPVGPGGPRRARGPSGTLGRHRRWSRPARQAGEPAPEPPGSSPNQPGSSPEPPERSPKPPGSSPERPPAPPPGADDPAESLGPIGIGKGEARPFEPKSVDLAKYLTARFTPDTIMDGWGTGFLTLRGASVRGGSHRWEGAPRQDSFAAALVPGKNWVVAAVADGVSAAPQSHIGAAAAVEAAVEYFVNTTAADVGRIDWRQVCETVADRLRLAARSLDRFEGAPGAI